MAEPHVFDATTPAAKPHKTALTFEEKITAAYMHYVRGIEQQDIAVIYNVNIGRVNEACMQIRKTLIPPGSERNG